VIPAIKKRIPASSSLPRLIGTWSGSVQQQGFDFCYDKKLYDRLEHDNGRVFAFIFVLILPTSGSSSVSLRTTTSPARARHFHRKGRAAAMPWLRFQGRDYCMKDSSPGER